MSSRVHGNHRRQVPQWMIVVVGFFCVLVLYKTNFLYGNITPEAGSAVGSIRHVPMTENVPNVMSTLDVDHCNAALKANPLEAFETTMKTPTKEEPNKVSWYYRLKNLQVMKTDAYLHDALLIMIVYNNKESWGKGRTVKDFLQMISKFDYPASKITLGILTSSLEEYIILKKMFHQSILASNYAQVSIVFRDDFKMSMSREDRHADSAQRERRRMLARYRNFALAECMEPWHSHVVWIDADIVSIPPYLVSKMVNSKLDILEPLCHLRGTTQDYDLNAWKGDRKVPTAAELEDMHAGKLFVADAMPGTLHMNDMRMHEYHPLDSVGGTMLYVKADIHRQGVLFTTHYIIGSEWKYEGYDGIETEGLCYVAGMLGYKCYAMPKDIIYHE